MNDKLTYQELEIQIAELKKQNENLLKLNQRAEENAERFKNLVNHSPDIIYTFSNKRGGLFWSDSIKKILGFEPDDIINNPFLWSNLIHPDDKIAVQKAINDNENGEDYNIEYRIKTKQGKWIWLHDYFMHKTVIDNEIIIEGHATDITERKEVEQKLKESREHLLIAQHISKTGSWIYDIETNTFNGSDEALKMYGFSDKAGDFIVEKIESCIPERERVHQALVDLITEERAYNIEFVVNPIDNSPQKIIASIALLEKNSQGKPTKVLGFLQDITDRKEAEQKLIKAKKKAEKNEKTYQALINSIPDTSILLFDKDLRYIKVGGDEVEKSGFDKSLIQGKTLQEAYPKDIVKIFEPKLRKAFNGETIVFEMQYAQYTYLQQIVPIRDNSGNIFATMQIATNITKKHVAVQALKNSQLFLKSSLESQKDTILLSINKDYQYLYYNSAHAKAIKHAYGKEIEVGMNILDCVTSDEDRAKAKDNYDRALRGETHSNVRAYGKENLAYYESFFNPILNDRNEIIGATGLARDVTDRKNIEQQVSAQNQELKKLNADKDRFISILAHDLKSPFSSILGFLGLLTKNIRKYDIDKIEKQLNLVNKSTQNTFSLLEDILMWVRANSGKIPFEPKKLDFGTICIEVIESLQLTANNKNITVNNLATDEFIIFADENMLNAVLRNLISNALKFTRKGGNINIYAKRSHEIAEITISDNGIGIEPEAINKLFDISQIISTEGTANEKGTGLGLLLCKEFVEIHDRKIWAESEIDKGSEFKFTLPVNKI